MGLRETAIRTLGYIKVTDGVDYSKCLTLGKQKLTADKDVRRLLKKYIDIKENINDEYCENLIIALNEGVGSVDAIDASPYEGANIIHDLNNPIDGSMKNKYTCIIDGGLSEHVFNFPIVINNIMDMLTVGGFYVGFLPMNNFCGHGFYQYSPGLFIQLFSKKNGFDLKHVFLSKSYSAKSIWEVVNMNVSERLELNGFVPYELYIIARKIREKNELLIQQADYEDVEWLKKSTMKYGKTNILKSVWRTLIPRNIRTTVKFFRDRKLNKKKLRKIRI